MTPGKRLTIGVTVNLERYENLRVAVEGDVESRKDAEDLVRYLDDVLAGFGKNDPETEKQIANYRFRVLPGANDAADGTADAAGEAVTADEDAVMEKNMGSGDDIVITPVPETHPSPENKSGATAPAAQPPEKAGPVCADCGAPITKQEDKLGRLFVDRPLCRSCLETLQKEQQD
jgi:hypothetical protein